MGINDQIIKGMEFDFCIIDEASQILLPLAIGPLLLAKNFVLVGDHDQVCCYKILLFKQFSN